MWRGIESIKLIYQYSFRIGMAITIEEITRFCKKKGFVFPNSEIYGGLSGFWDFGPLGVELKNNIKNELWESFVTRRSDIVGIDGANISHQKVWQASGHVTSFSDIMLECVKCSQKARADQLIEDKLGLSVDGLETKRILEIIKKHKLGCPKCKSAFKEGKSFNLMFKTHAGASEDTKSVAYLRPETAQQIFTNFKLVMETARMKLPFGIAQTGRAFRNEISPRDFLFRSREFEQFEIEFFTHPKKTEDCSLIKDIENLEINLLTAASQKSKKREHKKSTIKDLIKEKSTTKWHAYWIARFYKWFLDLGIKGENLRVREHTGEELAHYATACFDIEYKFPFGWKEIHGNASRGQFDLKQHAQHSKKDMSVFIEETKEKIIPCVASEPSQGIERAMLAFLFEAYTDDKKRGNIVLNLHPALAPVKAAVFPLVSNKEDITNLSKSIHDELKKHFNVFYDSGGSIGRRYARMDEVGCPYCVTVDFESLKNNDVTVRDMLTTKQVRIGIEDLVTTLSDLLYGRKPFSQKVL